MVIRKFARAGLVLAHASLVQLAAAFVVETVVWGFPTAYGTLLDGEADSLLLLFLHLIRIAYLDDPEYSSQRNATSLLALIGPIVSGIMHCACRWSSPSLYCGLTSTSTRHQSSFVPIPSMRSAARMVWNGFVRYQHPRVELGDYCEQISLRVRWAHSSSLR